MVLIKLVSANSSQAQVTVSRQPQQRRERQLACVGRTWVHVRVTIIAHEIEIEWTRQHQISAKSFVLSVQETIVTIRRYSDGCKVSSCARCSMPAGLGVCWRWQCTQEPAWRCAVPSRCFEIQSR
jgi:hypothetical protein